MLNLLQLKEAIDAVIASQPNTQSALATVTVADVTYGVSSLTIVSDEASLTIALNLE